MVQPIHQTESEEEESTIDQLKIEVSKLKEKLSIAEIEVSGKRTSLNQLPMYMCIYTHTMLHLYMHH